jgi:Tol biopolymer transport system component
MNGDPQLKARFDRTADRMAFDTPAALEQVRRTAVRRDRGRRIQALALAAAIVAVALVVVWRLGPSDRGFAPMGAGPGGTIAFLGEDGLSRLDLTTHEVSPLSSAAGSVTSAAWSPDGTRLAIALEGPDRVARVVVTERDGTDPITVFEAPDGDLPGPDLIGVAWSPDGSRLALAARAVAHGRTIVIVDIAGDAEPTVLDGHWESVSWSPDGSRLVASGFPQLEGGTFDLYAMAPDGSAVTQLTDDDAVEHQPSWSPDGSAIVFASGEPLDQDVVVIDADGTDRRNLTDRAGVDLAPVWSPDGRWIAFATDRDASAEVREANRSGETRFRTAIHVMRPDGSDERRVTEVGVMLPVAWTAS